MTVTLNATLDNKIRLDMNGVPEDVAIALTEALTIPNVEKEVALKQHVWGAEKMPDTIELFSFEGQELVMPRGFAKNFAQGVRAMGHKISWTDHRTFVPKLKIGKQVEPRAWQIPAIETMFKEHQGIYKAPAGSGKTVTMLALIRKLGVRSIIIVNTKDILWQWVERAHQFLGEDYPVGEIGGGKFEISEYLTIATAQTLHSRYDELEAQGFFEIFSLVCLDECHHATASTYNKVLDTFSARYRLGVSATPDKTGDFRMATNMLGPIIHTTQPDDVNSLMKPTVYKVPTSFGYGFRGGKSRWQRSNYPQMIQALITDQERNELIVSKILENQGHHQLVLSKRLEHLEILEAMLLEAGFEDPTTTLTGKDKNDHRIAAKELAANFPSVIFSTLADEALDVPRLDRAHLTFPQKNTGLVTQQVGRVERIHPDKKDAKIYDYYDGNVGPLDSQWKGRRFEVYEVRGYKIETLRKVNA